MEAARILAVDDSLTIRRLLETVLTGAGYVVDFAATGQEGIDRARASPPDLVLLDYVLPDMKGVDVAAALAQSESTRGVPILVMSAKNDDLRPLFRPFASVVGFLSKPFTPAEVCFLVGDLVARIKGTAGEPAEAAASFTRPQLEAGARALYAHLRERFARIPELSSGLGDAAPAPYFAKRILTPELMDKLLRGLAPVLRDALTGTGSAAADGSSLQGHTQRPGAAAPPARPGRVRPHRTPDGRAPAAQDVPLPAPRRPRLRHPRPPRRLRALGRGGPRGCRAAEGGGRAGRAAAHGHSRSSSRSPPRERCPPRGCPTSWPRSASAC